MSKVIRVTMFKIPSSSIDGFKKLYTTLARSAVKDGRPYILSLEAGPSYDDARNQGYSFIAKSEFRDLADMRYYDTECAAHQKLKAGAKDLGVEGVMTVFYTPGVVVGTERL